MNIWNMPTKEDGHSQAAVVTALLRLKVSLFHCVIISTCERPLHQPRAEGLQGPYDGGYD